MSIEFEHVYDHRTSFTRGVVQSVDDTGVAQSATVQTHDGVTRVAEVHQPFGFASVPPANGAVMLLICNGGDPSDLVALAASCPSGRLGGLQPGEAAIYAVDGTRVHIKLGGIVEIIAANQVVITAPNVTLTASGGIVLDANVSISGSLSVGAATSIDGNLSVTGNIAATGSITADA